MIFESINFLSVQMNQYFRNKFHINEDVVIVSDLINQDGSIAIKGENKVIISLINIEHNLTLKNNARLKYGQILGEDNKTDLNFSLLFSCYFPNNNYGESLKFISYVINYLQSNYLFSNKNSIDMPPEIDEITLTMLNYNLEELSNLWRTLGAKYMPSVVYKLNVSSSN